MQFVWNQHTAWHVSVKGLWKDAAVSVMPNDMQCNLAIHCAAGYLARSLAHASGLGQKLAGATLHLVKHMLC